MRIELRRFGCLVALVAILAFVFHVERAESSHSSSPSHHCCLCHTTVSSAASPLAILLNVVFFSCLTPIAAETNHDQSSLCINAPRAPPLA